MNKTTVVWVGLIVVALIAIGGYMYPEAQNILGGGTRFPNGLSADRTAPIDGQVRGTTLTITGASTFGSAGTAVTALEFGTCSPSFPSADLAASTTATGICTDSSVTTSDKFLATQRFTGATTGLPSLGLFPVLNVIATTSGQYGIVVTNFTGAASTSINAIYRTYSVQVTR